MLSISEIKRFIDEDKVSTKKQQAKKGLLYYEGRHDIKDYKVYFVNDDGLLEEDKTKSNERISHPFFTELTDQCVQYLLSGDTDYVRSDIPELQNKLNEYFDNDYKMELNDLLTYMGVEGFSYLYRYVDNNFKTRFKFAEGLNVVEVPAKYSSDKKDYIIYYYYWKTEKNKVIHKVEVWDDTNVYYYLMINGIIKEDTEQKTRPHVLYEEDKQQYYDTFGDIPFIRLDNNRKQTSDLTIIKDLIDDYDLMSCGLSNNIQDVAEGIYVIKGYTGNDISELTQSIRVKKQVAVGDNGDVDIKTVNIPYEARKTKLELDEKNIYRFGMGFDSSKAETSNVTNVVIKSRYALLDLKTN
ncbi:MAG: phage portal protein, partial [Erysipelotrichia bacterium]|nr:phage portal protein [Erysipelotrichia bacterium]